MSVSVEMPLRHRWCRARIASQLAPHDTLANRKIDRNNKLDGALCAGTVFVRGRRRAKKLITKISRKEKYDAATMFTLLKTIAAPIDRLVA